MQCLFAMAVILCLVPGVSAAAALCLLLAWADLLTGEALLWGSAVSAGVVAVQLWLPLSTRSLRDAGVAPMMVLAVMTFICGWLHWWGAAPFVSWVAALGATLLVGGGRGRALLWMVPDVGRLWLRHTLLDVLGVSWLVVLAASA